MNSNELSNFRARIEQSIENLDRSAAAMKSELRASSDVNSTEQQDHLDTAKGETDLKMRLEIHNHTVSRRGQLKNALVRIANGTFGLCLGCQEDIALRRLDAYPGATLCLECQHLQENGQQPEPSTHIFAPRWLGSDFGAIRRAA